MAEKDEQAPVARLSIKAVPGTTSSNIAGWYGDSLRIRVSAVPERGKTNNLVVYYLWQAGDLT